MIKNNYLNVIVVAVLLMVVVKPANAGPFGLEMGMQRSDLQNQGKELTLFKLRVIDVPKKHSAFKSYILKFGPRSGLCYVKAMGKEIKTDEYGKEIQSAFNNMEKKLQKSYGQDKTNDSLNEDSSEDDDDEWMESLLTGERTLAAYWDTEIGSTMKGNLASVILAAQATSEEVGYLVIDYKFDNYAQCESEISSAEDDAL